MGACRDIRKAILDAGAAEGWAVTRHLSSCTACVQWLADLQMAEMTIKRLPVPEIPPGFETRMACAIAQERGHASEDSAARGFRIPKFWIPVAASLAAAALFSVAGIWLVVKEKKAAPAPFEQGVALSVALNAAAPLPGADVMLHLPNGVDLAGATRSTGGRHVAWRQDLPAGNTAFDVGLVAFAKGDHRVDVVVCRKNDCATGTVVVHAGEGRIRLTSIGGTVQDDNQIGLSFALSKTAGIPTKEEGI
ncbi:MAG: hypothetical protein HY897_14840 [Deltaproteobacteria bacterium]|nr:hypothetical protein [Deltaproteobacteria bacterium]